MNKLFKTADIDWFKQRLFGLLICIIVAFIIIIGRLFYLQILEGEEHRRLSENNCIRLQTIEPARGLIYDRNGVLLVDNRPMYDLYITLKDAKNIKETIEKISVYTKIPISKFNKKIKKNKSVLSYKPILLKMDISRDQLAQIEAHSIDLPGVTVNVKPSRNYIKKYGATHLIGYLGEVNSKELKSGKYPGIRGGDYIGKFGVEKKYEKLLRGKRGGKQVEVNAIGQTVKVLKVVNAKSGQNVYLTIDQRLQEKTDALLEGVVGAVVAMDPNTGEVLVMSSSPSFDQNNFIEGLSYKQWDLLMQNPFRPMENKVIQGEYPPASTYKIVTAIAGLEEGIIDHNTIFNCPGFYTYGDRTFRCWKKYGHGKVDVIKALSESCDVFFYQVGQKLGVARLAWYAKALGLGSPTGVDLEHESAGLIPTLAWKKRRIGVSWQGGETLSIAIGQGYNLTTPIQMLGLISTISTNGIRYNPLIIKKIEIAEDKELYKNKPKVVGKFKVSDYTMNLIKKGLWEVVNTKNGTASIAKIKNYDIAGKTGTAQVIAKKSINDKSISKVVDYLKPHAWFVAYAPFDKPQIAIVVIVEHGEHGSSAAAPIAREIIKTYLSQKKTKL